MKQLIVLIILITLLASCSEDNPSQDIIPLYVGVEVTSEKDIQTNVMSKQLTHLFVETIPMPDVEKIDAKYFAEPNEFVYINVFLLNPDDQVILRLTIEGKTYQSFQFEEGSHAELLIIRYQVSSTSGLHDIVIEEIKYIESNTNQTKDVRFESDPSIRIAVTYQNHMTAAIHKVDISHAELSMEVTIFDVSDLFNVYQRLPMFYLFDGLNIVYSKRLAIGDNEIRFLELLPNKAYEYAIVSVYDLLDGLGNVSKVLDQKTITSKDAITLDVISSGQEDTRFEIESLDTQNRIEVTSISLFQGNTSIQSLTNTSLRTFENLRSNTEYEIVVTYRFIEGDPRHNNTFSISKSIQTLRKDTPTLNVSIKEVTDASFEVILVKSDVDDVFTLTSIDVFQGNTFIQTLNLESPFIFNGLLSNTSYNVVVTYTYDLNEGTGLKEEVISLTTQTLPKPVVIRRIEVLNTQSISISDLISLKVTYDNVDNVTVNAFEMNGVTYQVSLFLGENQALISFDGFDEGGFKDIEITGYFIGDKRFSIKDETFITIEIFSALSVLHMYNDFHNVITTNKTNVIIIDVSNDNLYDIYSVEITINNITYTYEKDDITLSLDKQTLTIPFDAEVSLLKPLHQKDLIQTFVLLQKITYGKDQESLITYDPKESKHAFHPWVLRLYTIEFSTIIDISTPDAFLNMESGNIYRLTQDLDFKDVVMQPMSFSGMIIGNNHTISNVVMTRYNEAEVGLFSYFSGVMKDLTLKDFRFTQLNTSLSASIGSLASSIGVGVISNVRLVGNHQFVSTHNGQTYLAGCVSGSSQAIMSKITMEGTCSIAMSTPEKKVSNLRIGGISGNQYGIIERSEVSGVLNIDINQINMGDRSYIGGIVGRNAGLIANNLYSGELNITESQSFGDFAIYYAGIVGLSSSVNVTSMRHNMVTGKITLDLKGSQTAQAFGGITGNLSFKDVIQTHIFMGEAYISGNFNITDYLGSEDVLGSQYVYDQSKIYKNQTLIEIKYGQTSENDLNLKSLYQSIGFDVSIWNFEDLDISEGLFPTLK